MDSDPSFKQEAWVPPVHLNGDWCTEPSGEKLGLVLSLEQPLAESHQSLSTPAGPGPADGGDGRAPRALNPVLALTGVRQLEDGLFRHLPCLPTQPPCGRGSGKQLAHRSRGNGS